MLLEFRLIYMHVGRTLWPINVMAHTGLLMAMGGEAGGLVLEKAVSHMGGGP